MTISHSYASPIERENTIPSHPSRTQVPSILILDTLSSQLAGGEREDHICKVVRWTLAALLQNLWAPFLFLWGRLCYCPKCSLPHPRMPHSLVLSLGGWLYIFILLNSSMDINLLWPMKGKQKLRLWSNEYGLDQNSVMSLLLPFREANNCLAVWSGKIRECKCWWASAFSATTISHLTDTSAFLQVRDFITYKIVHAPPSLWHLSLREDYIFSLCLTQAWLYRLLWPMKYEQLLYLSFQELMHDSAISLFLLQRDSQCPR